MNEELLRLYNSFNKEHLPGFFDQLVEFININKEKFEGFLFNDSLDAIKRFKASDFYLGTSEDNFKLAIRYYVDKIPNFSDRDICKNVINLLWDLATYMSNEVCPSCQDSTLKIASSLDKKQIYKTCDSCLITIFQNTFIKRPEEMVPATRKQVDSLDDYLNA